MFTFYSAGRIKSLDYPGSVEADVLKLRKSYAFILILRVVYGLRIWTMEWTIIQNSNEIVTIFMK